MNIIRPYEAEDNEVNTEQLEVIKHWAKRNGETLDEVEIYGKAVRARTETGRTVMVSMSDGCRSRYANVRQHFYMNELINGKNKRIKKSEW